MSVHADCIPSGYTFRPLTGDRSIMLSTMELNACSTCSSSDMLGSKLYSGCYCGHFLRQIHLQGIEWTNATAPPCS